MPEQCQSAWPKAAPQGGVVGVQFNEALGYPQVSIVYEEGAKRFIRRFSLRTVRHGQAPSVLCYSEFASEDWRTVAPANVVAITYEPAINAIKSAFARLSGLIRAYLNSPSASAEADLKAAVQALDS